MMDPERAAILLAKYVADELSPAEREELDLAFRANPGLRDALAVLQGLHAVPPGLRAGEEAEMLERGLSRLRALRSDLPFHEEEGLAVQREEAAVRGTVRRIPLFRWMAAACLLIVVVTGAVLYLRPGKRPAEATTHLSKEIATKFGTRSFLELPDGSKLWLNAGTKVHYTDGFADGKRELTLSGEAFFDIKHDPDHPFIVHIGGLDVTVLGTSFNVKAYPGDSVMETTLIDGKVAIGLAGKKAAGIIMEPNEKVIVPFPGTIGVSPVMAKDQRATAGVNFRRHHVAPDSIYRTLIETSWVDDKLVFRSEQFSEVAARLERWYNIKFRFENDKYLPMELTGYFNNQPIENVLHALSLSLGFHYTIEGGEVRVW